MPSRICAFIYAWAVGMARAGRTSALQQDAIVHVRSYGRVMACYTSPMRTPGDLYRVEFYVSQNDRDGLKDEAERLGVSVSALVRATMRRRGRDRRRLRAILSRYRLPEAAIERIMADFDDDGPPPEGT